MLFNWVCEEKKGGGQKEIWDSERERDEEMIGMARNTEMVNAMRKRRQKRACRESDTKRAESQTKIAETDTKGAERQTQREHRDRHKESKIRKEE